jgi:osmotically-inducible protein OsmY
VTIVSRDGNVTLRGTVKSLSEKQIIAEKAKQVSGVKNLDNQITVKK